jgi:hypothetical protein
MHVLRERPSLRFHTVGQNTASMRLDNIRAIPEIKIIDRSVP